MLTLFDDVFSPYARKVRIALYEKEVPFERVRALHGDCNRTDFLHVNLRAEVLALVDGAFQLYDSTLICEYIEDCYPRPPLYPRDPRQRAVCRLIEDVADTQLDAALYAITLIETWSDCTATSNVTSVSSPISQVISPSPTSPWPRM
jgi:glutathione S-transferase